MLLVMEFEFEQEMVEFTAKLLIIAEAVRYSHVLKP